MRLGLLIAFLLIGTVTGRGDDAAIRKLERRKLHLLTANYTEIVRLNKLGQASPSAVLDAQDRLYLAKLDTADSISEKIEVHEKLISIAEGRLELVRTSSKAGHISATEVNNAEIVLIERQIALAKLKAGQ